MKRRSSSLKKHTESNRVMRGAWKTDCEYILELYTEPLQSVSADRKPANDTGQSEVGCDGVDTRYRILWRQAVRAVCERKGGTAGMFPPFPKWRGRVFCYTFCGTDRSIGDFFYTIKSKLK